MQKTIDMERFIIKKLLKQRGMNLQQLADILQINRVNLYTSLSGNPTLGRLEEIAKILDVDVIDLFAKSPNKKNDLEFVSTCLFWVCSRRLFGFTTQYRFLYLPCLANAVIVYVMGGYFSVSFHPVF